MYSVNFHPLGRVALPTEGVDRNAMIQDVEALFRPSPSPRRAWIEIWPRQWPAVQAASPSPRRAWIEIDASIYMWETGEVALPTEGVDRNDFMEVR